MEKPCCVGGGTRVDLGYYSSVGVVTVQRCEEGGMGVCARVTAAWVVK